MEYIVNQQIKLPFTAVNLQTGKVSFNPVFLNNGSIVSVTPSVTEIGSGLYVLNFTPAATGKWTVFIEGQTQTVEIVSRTLQNVLGDVLDVGVGSWSWDKATGLLTLFKADSSVLATYTVVDTPQMASRERLT